MSTLHLAVKKIYFDAIKAGVKTQEFRLCTPYWERRLAGREYDGIMLTLGYPSTADAELDDATIRRCVGFAEREGFGAVEVVNLFAYRATDPAELRRAGYPVGPDNDDHIAAAVKDSAAVCLAWGAHAAGLERPQIVLPTLRRLGVSPMCLRITRTGYPQHPLMLASSCRLQPFTADAIQEAMSP